MRQLFIPFVFLLAACGTKAPVQEAAIPAETAKALIGEFAQALMGELTSAVQDQGPAKAIDVCAVRAPALAEKMSGGEFSIRRIGNRVRNKQTNTPTVEELRILQGLTPDSPVFQGEIDGHQAFMKAIHIPSPLCITCHGTDEQIPKDVQTALNQTYPSDEANNYKLGDLRGAFIVERN